MWVSKKRWDRLNEKVDILTGDIYKKTSIPRSEGLGGVYRFEMNQAVLELEKDVKAIKDYLDVTLIEMPAERKFVKKMGEKK